MSRQWREMVAAYFEAIEDNTSATMLRLHKALRAVEAMPAVSGCPACDGSRGGCICGDGTALGYVRVCECYSNDEYTLASAAENGDDERVHSGRGYVWATLAQMARRRMS